MGREERLVDDDAGHGVRPLTTPVALAALFDRLTAQHLDEIGVARGGSCWLIGDGEVSVARLLSQRVGPDGLVVITGRQLDAVGDPPPGVQLLCRDVVVDSPPGTAFDLVHARMMLGRVPEPAEALCRMVDALRPGGWLLVEDFDVRLQPLACPEARRPVEHRANRVRAGVIDVMARQRVHLDHGRALPRLLREAGLVDVRADGFFPLAVPAGAALEIAHVSLVRDDLITHGLASADEVDAHLEAVTAGRIDTATPPLISAWGRRP